MERWFAESAFGFESNAHTGVSGTNLLAAAAAASAAATASSSSDAIGSSSNLLGDSSASSDDLGALANTQGSTSSAANGSEWIGLMHDLPPSVVESPDIATSFAQCCFMVFDNYGADETSLEEDILLYFHPNHPGIPLRKRLLLMGQCHGIVSFASSFVDSASDSKHRSRYSSSDIVVVRLGACKFACKRIGEIQIVRNRDNDGGCDGGLGTSVVTPTRALVGQVLTGPIDHTDSTITSHLEAMYATFRFFHGDLSMLLKRFQDNRPRLVAEMTAAWDGIRPLLRHYRKTLIAHLDPLHVLPYTELPFNTTRHLVAASQLLTTVSRLGNLGGAIFYEKTLLCSHLDLDVTRFILTRVESIKTLDYLERHHHQGHLFSSLGRDRDRGLSEPDFTPVYITDEQYNRMFGERDRRAADVAAIPESVRYLLDPPPNGLFVGLCIITMTDVSLAVLMDLELLYDKRHISKLRLAVDNKLYQLEQSIYSTLRKQVQQVSPTTQAPAPTEASGQNYNWMLYNSLTSTVKPGASLKGKSEVDNRFLTGCAFVHDMFETNRSSSKILLVDHCGFICGKRAESKEVYFQRSLPLFSTMIDFRGLERLEDDARDTLATDRQIFTL